LHYNVTNGANYPSQGVPFNAAQSRPIQSTKCPGRCLARQLLAAFNPDWHTRTNDFLQDERKASVNSLVALRHRIAHGESVGTTLSQVKRHFVVAIDVAAFIADLVAPITT
jgi:hypothetical protein